MDTTLEVLTVGGGRRRNRKWPDEVKARIVAETLRPGASVARGGATTWAQPNHVSAWRTMARQGKLVLPAPEDAMEFAAMVVATPSAEPPINAAEPPEIIVGPVTIRLEAGASADRIAAIARALGDRRHDLSIKPGADHGGDEAGGLPQGP